MKRKTSVEICLLMMVVACSFSLLAHEKPLVAVMPVEEGI